MRLGRDETKLKIMQFQLRTGRWHGKLFVSIPGEVTQKGAKGAAAAAETVRKLAEEAMHRSRWTYVPRAQVAVQMHFRTQNRQSPDLQNLVKFYLDPLRSVLFADDRQVRYLEAHYWRSSPDDIVRFPFEPSTHIQVERLVDYNRRIRLYESLLSGYDFDGFKEYLHDHLHLSEWREIMDDEEGFELPTDIEDTYALLLASPRTTANQKRDIQKRISELRDSGFLDRERLERSKLRDIDQPRTLLMPDLRNLEPFTINLGGLPQRGQSDAYKQRIRQQIALFGKTNCMADIKVPVELDVQVGSQGLRLGKDLDNIMRDIAPALKQELLNVRSYISGYRIYTISSANGEDPVEGIRIKLLNRGAIQDLQSRIDKVLEVAEEWIDDELW